MKYEGLLTDLVLLAIFFLILYIIAYCITHYPDIADIAREFMENRNLRLATSFILFPISIIFITIGIRLLLELRLGGGRIALGFILTAIGVSMLIYSIATLVDTLLRELSRYLHSLTLAQRP